MYKQDEKHIVAVSNGPFRSTVVLSHLKNIGYLLSSSTDGKSWTSQELKTPDEYYEHLVNTDANGIDRVVAYGSNNLKFLTSADGLNWQLWAFPNPCQSEHHCYYNNSYFDNVSNGFVLLQSRTHDSIETNKMHFTTNLTDWYEYPLPFKNDYIKSAFKAKDDILLVSVGNEESGHKLWLTPDYKNWVSYDLPKDSEVRDAKVDAKNRIGLLLSYKSNSTDSSETIAHCQLINSDNNDEQCPPCPCEEHHDKGDNGSNDDNSETKQPHTNHAYMTDLVVIDPETKEQIVYKTFKGLVNNMSWFDDKLYLSGDFVNSDDDKHAALAVMGIA